MISKRVFLVVGEESGYDESNHWVVAAWDSEKDANKHLKLVADYAERHFHTTKYWDCEDEAQEIRRAFATNPYDPDYEASAFDQGVSYGIEECEPFELHKPIKLSPTQQRALDLIREQPVYGDGHGRAVVKDTNEKINNGTLNSLFAKGLIQWSTTDDDRIEVV